MLKSLKRLKTVKDIKTSNLEILRLLNQHIKGLEIYIFCGIKLEHSPARFLTNTKNGVPIIIKNSEPSFRDVIRFMGAYVDYVTEYIPDTLKTCTHPWSPLAERTIDPVTLLECITGKVTEGNFVMDTNAVSTIETSIIPWKELFSRVLNEDPRLSQNLGLEFDNGALLRYTRQQMTKCLYCCEKKYKDQLFLNRWFLKVVSGEGILCIDKYKKLKLRTSDVVEQFSKLNNDSVDMKTHFQLTVRRTTNTTESVIKFHVVPDVKMIVEDFFNPEISVDDLGSRKFLIIFMLVNARVMNVETGLESFFSSLQSQNFSGG